MAIAGGVGRRALVCVGLSTTQSRHARNGSRTGVGWTPWFSEPAKNELERIKACQACGGPGFMFKQWASRSD